MQFIYFIIKKSFEILKKWLKNVENFKKVFLFQLNAVTTKQTPSKTN